MALNSRRVLVTGACGTVGKELFRQLLEEHRVKELVALDNNESELFFLEQRFAKYTQASFFLADVRDKDRLCDKIKGIDVVFHTAAFKHVLSCERSPFAAVIKRSPISLEVPITLVGLTALSVLVKITRFTLP